MKTASVLPKSEAKDETSLGSSDYAWERVEESTARRKIDFCVLLPLFLGMIMFQLDRMNVASALTGGFAEDISIDQDTINLGNQLMFLGIIVLEIPSNMVLQRIGPCKWIPIQVFVFGLTAIMQLFVRNRAGFLAVRMLLGLVESGYIPGSLYTLSTWYPPHELGKRVAVLFFGMFGGNAISPLLGAGILRLHGAIGMKGWQLIFLIEGLVTLSVALLLCFILPQSPASPKPLLLNGLLRLSDRERHIVKSRLGLDNGPFSDHGRIKTGISWTILRDTVLNYRRWLHFIATPCVFSTWSPLTTYTPSIMIVQANALSAIGALLALPLVFFFAWMSDRTKRRGLPVIAAILCYLVALAIARSILPRASKWTRFGMWTMINAFAVCYHPAHNVWVQLNCQNQVERSITISMWVMFANSGMMAGSQIFRGNDAPEYLSGLLIMIALVSSGLVLAIFQEMLYLTLNSRLRRSGSKAMYTP
ncbi:hypothetical protein AOCH_000374 [Aspergillus ochraceoroseus]|uniref:Major facilitator superfamily (MFS) profile domain-containing protein n=1 Tax=Aspergillus ochraceoroseus TaxID=138278 RepID=A0A0F8U6N9_9EURO|nr:hypothetical protein AOCH_000374 [Aspergillus ochraceoroseus]